ncbi:MAG TPA: hypothetical protein VFO15_18060 [Xanthobacteraceae bacterium]|nr:hypothetical protein [Xanthobacteraceae bacterium]
MAASFRVWTDPEAIADVLFWAHVEGWRVRVELKAGAVFPGAYVRELRGGGAIVHLGTKTETHAVVHVRNIVRVSR